MPAQSSAPEDGRNYRPKQVELIEIINKPLLLHLVGYLYYWQMGFDSVFKGLISKSGDPVLRSVCSGICFIIGLI